MTHVLVVEDVQSTRLSIEAVLRKAGYHVSVAEDGEQALDLLEQQEATQYYDAIITDIQMGSIDGLAVLQAARHHDPYAAVIVLTGFGTMETAITALRSGAYDYLHKPCEPEDLLQCVKGAIQRHVREVQKARAIQSLKQIAAQFDAQPEHPAEAQAEPLLASAEEQASLDIADQEGEEEGERYYRLGELCIDNRRHSVSFADETIHLTPIEYALLRCLAQAPGTVLEYIEIARSTHGHIQDKAEAQSLLKPHVHKLRRKIKAEYFVSVRGVGYMLEAPAEV